MRRHACDTPGRYILAMSSSRHSTAFQLRPLSLRLFSWRRLFNSLSPETHRVLTVSVTGNCSECIITLTLLTWKSPLTYCISSNVHNELYLRTPQPAQWRLVAFGHYNRSCLLTYSANQWRYMRSAPRRASGQHMQLLASGGLTSWQPSWMYDVMSVFRLHQSIWCVFTWITILPYFIPIWFETTES